MDVSSIYLLRLSQIPELLSVTAPGPSLSRETVPFSYQNLTDTVCDEQDGENDGSHKDDTR